MTLPENKQQLLEGITNELKQVDGVEAIVLGGSYATGMAAENSDLDIGIYYFENNPFDIERIRIIAKKLSVTDQPTVTGFYEWGPWVNGGAWINTKCGEVDFLYKNIDQIIRTIDNAQNGIWENDFEQQPPYGFSSIILLAEVQNSLPLYDPGEILNNLKESVRLYPQKLKQAVIQHCLWSAEFTIWQAEKFAVERDIFNTAGCITRATKSIVNALFAINEIYPMGDKRAIKIIEQSKIRPKTLSTKIDLLLSLHVDTLIDNVSHLKKLFDETVSLADGMYTPYYKL